MSILFFSNCPLLSKSLVLAKTGIYVGRAKRRS
jgi:hypothetical protein